MTPDDNALALLARGRPATIEVAGGSMLPWLRTGDRVRIEPTNDARPGDVALVLVGPRWVLHRVVARAGDRVVTRGDSAARPDADGAPVRVIGVATRAFSPRGRRRPFPRGHLGAVWLRCAPTVGRALHAAARLRARVAR